MGEVVMQAFCAEPEGLVLREVRLLHPTKENAIWLFLQLRGVPSLVSNQPLEHFRQLEPWLLGHVDFYLVDNVGILAISFEQMPIGTVHFTFWDRRMRGREELCRRMLEWALDYYGLVGAWTATAACFHPAIAFAKRVGFQIVAWEPGASTDSRGKKDDRVVMTFMPTCTVQPGADNGLRI